MKKFALIVNPVSGSGRAAKAARRAAHVLSAAGAAPDILETRHAGHGMELAGEAARTHDLIVAVGGDGTLGEVARGARAAGVPVGLVPVGTANVVARELGIPRHAERAARLLLEGTVRTLDAGEVNGRLFLAMVGVGFDGEVVRNIAEARSGPITMATYLKPSFRALREHAAEPLRVDVDGAPLPGPSFGLIVSNTRNYGGLFSVTPDASIADGWFDFQQRRRAGLWPVVRCGVAAALRRRAAGSVASYGRGRSFIVDAAVPVAVQVDGDYFGTTPVEIRILPGAVRILAPAAQNSAHA